MPIIVLQKRAGHGKVPRDKAQIGISHLVQDEVLAAHLGQMAINHRHHALRLLQVPLDSARELLVVEHGEPERLAVVRALARGLEEQPLLLGEAFLDGRVAELVLFVVRLDEVGEDGAGLPEGEAAIFVVDDGGHAAVGVDVRLGPLVRGGKLDGLVFVGDAHLFEHDLDLPWVRSRGCRYVSH